MPIEVRHLTHTYSQGSAFQATAIMDVNLTIQDGEFIGVIGHTGSGKSTLVQHLNGLLTPTSGQVLIDGEDMNQKGVDRRRIRQKVGLVFQYPEYQLFEETIAKDIAFGPKNLGLSPEEVDRRVRRAMEWVHLDYDRYAQRSPFELSGGQMRRVAIAGVLAMESKVLILDEPTAGLDPRGRDRILDMVKQLHAQGGVTVIMVSHSMEEIADSVERLVVVNDAHIPMDGTPREVFSHGDELEAMGLAIPQVTRIFRRLKELGLPVDASVYTTAQAVQVLEALKGGGAAC